MNERIKELAMQADPEYTGDEDDNMGHALVGNAAIQRFAELIVKECAMLIGGFEITQEVALDEYVDYEASAVLKEHFGVE